MNKKSESIKRLSGYRSVLKDLIDSRASTIEENIRLLDELNELLYSCEKKCREIAKNKGVDERQSSVAIVGSLFPWGVCYLLERVQELGGLPDKIKFSLSKEHDLVKKYATVRVGNEILKPDMDLLIFSDEEQYPIIIFSLKTSLRERAGQTHRWKMVLDIALNCKELKSKYELEYEAKREIKFGFITTNFYNEIGNPQQRANLRFFDFVYLARRDVDLQSPIKRLSSIVEDLGVIYGDK